MTVITSVFKLIERKVRFGKALHTGGFCSCGEAEKLAQQKKTRATKGAGGEKKEQVSHSVHRTRECRVLRTKTNTQLEWSGVESHFMECSCVEMT